jgi:hypothetical protein
MGGGGSLRRRVRNRERNAFNTKDTKDTKDTKIASSFLRTQLDREVYSRAKRAIIERSFR